MTWASPHPHPPSDDPPNPPNRPATGATGGVSPAGGAGTGAGPRRPSGKTCPATCPPSPAGDLASGGAGPDGQVGPVLAEGTPLGDGDVVLGDFVFRVQERPTPMGGGSLDRVREHLAAWLVSEWNREQAT
jgi:hypothetical protein